MFHMSLPLGHKFLLHLKTRIENCHFAISWCIQFQLENRWFSNEAGTLLTDLATSAITARAAGPNTQSGFWLAAGFKSRSGFWLAAASATNFKALWW